MIHSSWGRFASGLLIIFPALTVPAKQDRPTPEEQPRRVTREIKKAYADWIKDVDIILTQAERDAWKKLATDEEREKLIETVWRVRDPDPDTEANEFKEQFYDSRLTVSSFVFPCIDLLRRSTTSTSNPG